MYVIQNSILYLKLNYTNFTKLDIGTFSMIKIK